MLKENLSKKNNWLLVLGKKAYWFTFFVFILGLFLGGLLVKLWLGRNDQSLFSWVRQKGSYQFINPLLDFEPLEETKRSDLVGLRRDLEDLIEEARGGGDVLEVSVYFKELISGAWLGVNEKEKFAPASLLKVPLMITFLKIAEDDQDYLNQTIEYQRFDEGLSQNILPEKELNEGESYSVGTLIRRMIVYSDNQAMYLLSDHVDESKVEKVFFDLGLKPPDDSNEEDFITTRDYAAIFRILYNASYLSREMSEKALRLLSEVSYDNGLAAGLPEGVKIANKFGERVHSDGLEQFHDCGIIYYPDKPYLLCVMTRGTDFGALQQTVQEISRNVYRVASF